jgi:hypothetical protein
VGRSLSFLRVDMLSRDQLIRDDAYVTSPSIVNAAKRFTGGQGRTLEDLHYFWQADRFPDFFEFTFGSGSDDVIF